jgi:Sulfatase-modifying factor enzyme 1
MIALIMFIFFTAQESHEVTVGEFRTFVQETGYITTAEEFGWSVIAIDNQTFTSVPDATWYCPDGQSYSDDELPVTQVSWYDAMKYCEWAGAELYSIEEWKKSAIWDDPNISGKVMARTKAWAGNVWEWTKEGATIGGSYLCSINTCAGYTEGKSVHWPGKDAGSNNIGFRIKK